MFTHPVHCWWECHQFSQDGKQYGGSPQKVKIEQDIIHQFHFQEFVCTTMLMAELLIAKTRRGCSQREEGPGNVYWEKNYLESKRTQISLR